MPQLRGLNYQDETTRYWLGSVHSTRNLHILHKVLGEIDTMMDWITTLEMVAMEYYTRNVMQIVPMFSTQVTRRQDT